MQYQIAVSQTLRDLENICNALICEGWEPQGGISIGERQTYAQAMIKEDEEEESNSAMTWAAIILYLFAFVTIFIWIFYNYKQLLVVSCISFAISMTLFLITDSSNKE